MQWLLRSMYWNSCLVGYYSRYRGMVSIVCCIWEMGVGDCRSNYLWCGI